MAELPPLARTVGVGSTYYGAGDVPTLAHARKITNPKNWTGGKVPDFDAIAEAAGDDDVDAGADKGVTNGSAANAQRSGLPGFGADSQPLIVQQPDPNDPNLVSRSGGEGAGSGDGGEGGRAADAEDDGGDPTGGAREGEGGGDDTPAGGTSTTSTPVTTKAARTSRRAGASN
jgi:hypothetical protein